MTLGEPLFLSGLFRPKSLVPEVLSNSGSGGRQEVVKGQGAGDKDQGVWDDLLDSRLDWKRLQGRALSGTALAHSRCSTDICQLLKTETGPCLEQSPLQSPAAIPVLIGGLESHHSRVIALGLKASQWSRGPWGVSGVLAPTHSGHMVTM